MTKTSQTKNDNNDINLIDLLIIILEGKWKIAIAMGISVLAIFAVQIISVNESKNFTATTEINPINSAEESKYISFQNNIKHNDIFQIKTEPEKKIEHDDSTINFKDNATPMFSHSLYLSYSKKNFLNLYLESLNEKTLFKDAIRKFNLLDSSKYKDEKTYNEAIIKLASEIKIITRPLENKKNKNDINTSSFIQFIYNDVEKWKSVLSYVDTQANKSIQLNLQNQFDRLLSFYKQQNKYRLEDISTSINNLIIDYDRETSDKILYLEEQASIAEKLGIANNAIEVATFSNENVSIYDASTKNLVPNLPFYLKGYIAINEEIELLRTRTDKKAFIPELLKLEQSKRSIEQDKTLERAKLFFSKTPVGGNEVFTAATANVYATTFKFEAYNKNKLLILGLLFGFLIGVFFVLVQKGLQSKKQPKKH